MGETNWFLVDQSSVNFSCEERTQILAVTHARYGSDSTDTNILFKKDAMRDGHCIMNTGECQEVVSGV